MTTNGFVNRDDYKKFRASLTEKQRAIFDLGCATGLRISDILRLTKRQLKIEKPTIIEQKTGKSKRIYIPKKVRFELTKIAETSPNEYVFYSPSKSGHISRQAIFKAFKSKAEKIGIKQNIATHSMRKFYAMKLMDKGKSIKYIQAKLNHANQSETLLYLMDAMTKERNNKNEQR